jgi:hypothetical protein
MTTRNVELWADGQLIGRGFAALASLPDTPAQREAVDRMFRIEARAVDAQERCDDAERRRDRALEEQRQAQAVVDAARTSLINQLCERADDLGRRIDAFERKRVRQLLDSLPDPDDPEASTHVTGELRPIGRTERRNPGNFEVDTADAHDQIPDPKDPTGASLQL